MTEIKISKLRRGCDITICGHAMAVRNEQDNDLVCCAISTIVCTGCAILEQINSDGKLDECITLATPANSRLYFVSTRNNQQYVEGIQDTIIAGFEGLQNAYPEYVTIKYL